MSELFLTSSVHAVAHDLVKGLDLSLNNTLVFITTAAEPETGDKSWLENDRQALVKSGFMVTDYTITDKTAEQLRKDLEGYKYIYLSGGNTLHLLQESRKSGFIHLVQELVNTQGKIYIGTSAGSIIAGIKCPEYLLTDEKAKEDHNLEGYGFVNFVVVPHWGSEGFKDLYLNKRLKKAYKTDQIPLITLTDTQYVHVVDNRFEIVDSTQ